MMPDPQNKVMGCEPKFGAAGHRFGRTYIFVEDLRHERLPGRKQLLPWLQ
jgi:hypothetical protein